MLTRDNQILAGDLPFCDGAAGTDDFLAGVSESMVLALMYACHSHV